jgi:2-C-methyl-D-erythritol 4-phosphate cytidylyltransferase
MQYSAIIPAAGTGSRMQAAVPKVLLSIDSSDSTAVAAPASSILGRTLLAFCGDVECRRIIVCFPFEWQGEFERYRELDSRIILVPGGATRQQSVARGVDALRALTGDNAETVVLVHDAARCNLSYALLRRVVAGVAEKGAVTAALPVADAVCRTGLAGASDSSGAVAEYVDRSQLFLIQTPQGFYLKDLARAHAEAVRHDEGKGREDSSAEVHSRAAALDDASLVMRLRTVHTVLGDPLNIKATHPHDRELLRQIVQYTLGS